MIEFPKYPEQENQQITFHSADVDFELTQETNVIAWLQKIIEDHDIAIKALHYIFCSDIYLSNLNIKFLDHDTLTDIITFPLSEDPVESEIYISVDRVRENSSDLSVPFDTELSRVIVHGLLHLIGYGDKTEDEQAVMRQKENECLRLR